jgi:hypothetical protein
MAERILIAASNPWSFCLAVERDAAAIERPDEVDAIDIFRLCGRESPHWRGRDRIIETLNRKIDRFVMPAINGRDITADIAFDRGNIPPLPATYDALRAYEMGGAKIGLAVLSSVSSLTTIQFPRDLAEFGPALAPAWRSAHISMRIGEAVRQLGYDRVWIFNGRHCATRPFCDLIERDSELIRYEQGSAGDHYIRSSRSIHHPAELAHLIETHDFDPEAGEQFFRERLEKDAKNEVGLISAPQSSGQLPAGVRPGSTISFFTSASDEMFAVTDDAAYGDFATQHDIAVALADACQTHGLTLIVRLHPHLRFKHPAWLREWNFAELERGGAVVLQPTDPCDSYALVRASRGVITVGSTIGLEASYLGIPNAVVGRWLGGCLGASIEANSASHLADFIADPQLPPEARQRALQFGSFYKCGGKPLASLDVGSHPHFARIDGRIVDPIRYALQKIRGAFRPPTGDPNALDIRSGMQGGRVILPPGTDYSSASKER